MSDDDGDDFGELSTRWCVYWDSLRGKDKINRPPNIVPNHEERRGLVKEAITPTVKNAQKVTQKSVTAMKTMWLIVQRYCDSLAPTEQRRGKLNYNQEISSD